jgi:phosphoglycolate phosphatase-like HAD superfamily hydrolase
MTYKILSDFDGVWTDQAIEAEAVKLYLVAEASRLAEVPGNRALAHFRAFEQRAHAHPEQFGWAPDGRITAYLDEDPFCVPNSIASWIERGEGPRERHYRDAILASGFDTITAFADHCFFTATAGFRREHPPALVPGARELLTDIQAAGAEVVLVSNSESSKIIGWFEQVGVEAGECTSSALRVRGAAGKQVLGDSGETIDVAGRRIHVDRPLYRTILEEERPDLVIGDVFSLDLSLPHVLRAAGANGAPSTLVLRDHAHTPGWIRDTRAGGAIDHLVDSVSELPALVRAALAESTA